MRSTLILAFSLLSTFFCRAQLPAFDWVQQTSGKSSDEGKVIDVDATGNIYEAGNFAGTADFNSDSTNLLLTSRSGFFQNTSSGGFNLFLLKKNGAGDLIWVKQFEGRVYCVSMTVDDSNQVYLSGNYKGTIDIDPGPGLYNLSSVGNWENTFICKLDSSGNLVWANSEASFYAPILTTDHSLNLCAVGSNSVIVKYDSFGTKLWTDSILGSNAKCLAIGLNNEIIISGHFNSITDFDPGPGVFNLNGITGKSFMVKLDSLGNFIWADAFGNGDVNSIAVDQFDYIYFTGDFKDTADFDPGPGVFDLISLAPSGYTNSFISKHDSAGNLIWAKSFECSSLNDSKGISLAIDNSSNKIISTGEFRGIGDFDPGPGACNLDFINGAKYISILDSSGNFIIAKNSNGYPSWLCVDENNNIYVTGSLRGTGLLNFGNTYDFDPDTGICLLKAVGDKNIFIEKFDSTINLDWAESILGSQIDFQSIGADGFGNVYTGGFFKGNVDFDPGINDILLPWDEKLNCYIKKTDPSGNLIWVRSFTGSFDTHISLKVQNNGEVYIYGTFNDTIDFDPGPGNFDLIDTTITNSFFNKSNYICKLNSAGIFIWAKLIVGNITIFEITTDPTDNILLTGGFTDTIDFDPGPGTYFYSPPYPIAYNSAALYILKLDQSGNFVWVKSVGDSLSGIDAWAITTDPNGNVIVSGIIEGIFDFDSGPGTSYLSSPFGIYFLKLNPSGNFEWAKNVDDLSGIVPVSMSSDELGNVLITGSFYDSADFDPGPGIFSLSSTNNGGEDCFVLKLNSLGDYVWAKSIQGKPRTVVCDADNKVFVCGIHNGSFSIPHFLWESDETGDSVWYTDIGGVNFHVNACQMSRGASGVLYISGDFDEYGDFDPSQAVNNLVNSGMYDIFLLKLNQLNVGMQLISSETLTIFPNPSQNYFNIRLNREHPSINVRVFSSIGQLISENTFDNTNIFNLEFNSPPGLYFAEIKTSNGDCSRVKLIKN